MLETLLSAVTAKAVAVAAAGATVAGGAALVVLPAQADDSSNAVDAVEAVEAPDEVPAAPSSAVELDATRTDDTDLDATGGDEERTPPEDTFGATVHQLQEEHPDRGQDFGHAVADAAREQGAERDAAPIPAEARDRIPADPGSQGDGTGGAGDEARADAGGPEETPAGPPADSPAEGRPGR